MISRICARESVEIRLLRETDVPAALALGAREGWNQTASDWTRLLHLNPQGCFAAFSREQLIGTVTVIIYDDDLAWIGMMLVEEQHRGQGIGKRLMRTALDHCRARNVSTVRLDATPSGRPLYEALGFDAEERVERWQGIGSATTPTIGASSCNCLPELHELDARAFYAPREELVNSLLENCGVAPAFETGSHDGGLQGYALTRAGAHCWYVGPVIATTYAVAIALLNSVLGKIVGSVCLDVRRANTGSPQIVDALREWGFSKQRELTRMYLLVGKPRRRCSGAASDLMFASAGPELG